MPLRSLGKTKGFGCDFRPPEPTPYHEYDATRFGEARRSHVTLSTLIKDLKEYSVSPRLSYDEKTLRKAITITADQFRLPQRQPITHLCDVFELDLNVWRSSPGVPFRDQGFKTKGEVRDSAKARTSIRTYWSMVKSGKKMKPPTSLAFARSHIVKGDKPDKVRAVWCYPMTMVMGEVSMGYQLLQAYKKGGTPIAYGYELGRGGFARLSQDVAFGKSYCLDFKKFDKTIANRFTDIAFNILAENIDFGAYHGYGVPDAQEISRMWAHIVEYFKNTTVLTPDGELWLKSGGIPSGSYFTSLVGSIVNALVLNYTWIKLCGKPPHYLRVFGDDSVICHRGTLDMCDLVSCCSEMGLTVNAEKSTITNGAAGIKFLGFEIRGLRPYKPLSEWMQSLCFPERPDQSIDDYYSRTLGLMYANLGLCSEFHDLCERILKGKVFNLQLTRTLERNFDAQGLAIEMRIPRSSDFWTLLW